MMAPELMVSSGASEEEVEPAAVLYCTARKLERQAEQLHRRQGGCVRGEARLLFAQPHSTARPTLKVDDSTGSSRNMSVRV